MAAAYASAGLDAPERYVWVPSPARGAVAAAVIAGHGEALEAAGLGALVEQARADLGDGEAGGSVLPEVRTRLWEEERAAACSEQGPEQWPRTWAETGGLLWNQVQALVARVRGAIGEQAHGPAGRRREPGGDPAAERGGVPAARRHARRGPGPARRAVARAVRVARTAGRPARRAWRRSPVRRAGGGPTSGW
ncbi:hypothetical protein LUX39_14755 [Actinomadura madurae]|nr:hypothetical protein [Actinomadura madurae]